MKTNLKKEAIRWGVIMVLATMMVAFTQCVATESGTDDSSSYSDPHTIPNEPLIPADSEEAPEVGVKDADRIYQTMSALTGVPTTDSTVRNMYNNDYKAQMPNNARVEAMLETHILGATKMATEFCNQLVNNGTLRAAIWPGFNFTAAPSSAFEPDSRSRESFIVNMLERFWGVGVLEPQEYEEGYDTIDALISEAMVNQNANGGGTQNIAKIACTAALASPQVIMQ